MIEPKIIDQLIFEVENKYDAFYAKKMTDYMKGHFSFLGVASPMRKKIFASWYAQNKSELLSNQIAYARHLWSLKFREYHYFAMLLLSKGVSKYDEQYLEDCKYFITTHSWWDTVDWIASNMLGSILKKDKQLQYQVCEDWSSSDNIWLQRSAIIHQLKYKMEVDHELLFALIDGTQGSKEFFINKASGWALRELSKRKPQLVRDYLASRDSLSGLTVREGSKYL